MTAAPLIVSLFDSSGVWLDPYKRAGYRWLQVDLKRGWDVYDPRLDQLGLVHGVLAAPPCTEFAYSGQRWWPLKDTDGRTAAAVRLVNRTLELLTLWRPYFWALENPGGRIDELCPWLNSPRHSFDPCDYGDPWTKRTYLWGRFGIPWPYSPVVPWRGVTRGKDTHHSIDRAAKRRGLTRTMNRQAWRSMTPPGFAQAFFNSNP